MSLTAYWTLWLKRQNQKIKHPIRHVATKIETKLELAQVLGHVFW